MIGKVILNIIVKMIIVPMLIYQSDVISLYFPCHKNVRSLVSKAEALYFMFKIIMMRAMFMIIKNDRLIV